MAPDVIIAGVGSPFAADRFGWAVVDALQDSALPAGVRAVACAKPVELVPLLLSAQRAIVVDAMLGEYPPGTICPCGVEMLPQVSAHLSSHGVGLADAVHLAMALGMPPERLTVMALSIGSPTANIQQKWVAAMCQAVLALVQDVSE